MATFTGHDIQEAAKGTFCPLLCCDLWSSLGWMGSNVVGVVKPPARRFTYGIMGLIFINMALLGFQVDAGNQPPFEEPG